MTRFSSKKLCVCAGLALVIPATAFLLWPPVSPKPGIFVLGYTNDPTIGPSVLFSLTNQTGSRMTFLIAAPQTKTAGWWSPAPFDPQRAYRDFDLPPHQSTNFAVQVPSEPNPWRVPVFYGYLPSGTERLRGELRYNMRVNWIRLKHREIPRWMRVPEFNMYPGYSPEIAPRPNAEPTNAANSDMSHR